MRAALSQGGPGEYSSRIQKIHCCDIKFVFCHVLLGLGVVCCYEILCLIWPRLIMLTMVSAAEMRAVGELTTDRYGWAVLALAVGMP